jgi:hypothetical protein
MLLSHACRLARDTLLGYRYLSTNYVINEQVRETLFKLGLHRRGRRGCRAGTHVQARRHRHSDSLFTVPTTDGNIPVVSGNRPQPVSVSVVQRTRVFADAMKTTSGVPCQNTSTAGITPSIYVLNVAAITKPHAVEHLTADLTGYKIEVAVITETHLKKKHAGHHFAIEGYTLFRRDRVGRRGGGVAVYVNSDLSADVWTCPGDSAQFELLWVRVQVHTHITYVGALYHPPKPQYQPAALLDYIEAGVDAVTVVCPSATIVLAGDFNMLDDTEVATRGALLSIVDRPTRGMNILDRVYVNNPCYTTVRVVDSTVKSDHKAVVAYPGQVHVQPLSKCRHRRLFRRRSPAQHARFLEYATTLNIEFDNSKDVQINFDIMYGIMVDLLDRFYPEREITVTSSDPPYVTPAVKALLRRKNRLMHAGRTEEAGAIAVRIRTTITRSSSKWLRKVDTQKSAKEAWAKVREVIKGKVNRAGDHVDGLTAQKFNDHYAAISTDADYRTPRLKMTAPNDLSYITEMDVFRMLDTLRPTATGLDQLPAWFLRLGAPIFAAPLASLFHQSLVMGVVPRQWKTAVIAPIPKVAAPAQPSDFRPISITPVLSRSLERFVVRQFIYPALLQPCLSLDFSDQFAFRPTGSTTAALVAMLHTVRSMLADNDYVRVFSFDFSKAFDTVRHSTLTNKLAQLELPDSVYNWVVDFLGNHAHCTKYAGLVSAVATIHASVIQGSAIGPVSYVVTAADLHPVHDGNCFFKFADDTYLVVPGVNTDTCQEEIQHLQAWAADNNLKLNRDKTKEIVFTARREAAPPPPRPGIERVSSLRILGVIVNDKLTAADHVATLLSSGSSLLYAMRVLRAHGTPSKSLHDIFRATVVTRIQYAAPAWSGMCSAADHARLDSLLRRGKRLGYSSGDVPAVVADLFNSADDDFFHCVKTNSNHVLHVYLPDKIDIPYWLRTRNHNLTLINKTKFLNDTDFFIRMLYKYSY